MYDPVAGSTNEATPSSLGLYQAWDNLFFTVDDKETLVFGAKGWSWDVSDPAQGIYFTQKSATYTGGKYKVKLSTKQFGDTSWTPPPVKVLTDGTGNLYGLFIGYRTTGKQTVNGYTSDAYGVFTDVYQILPYSPVRKAKFKAQGDNLVYDWWGAMNGVDVQINDGYAYAVEKESFTVSPDTYGARTIIKAVNMGTKKEVLMLNGSDWTTERYDIYNWKLVGNKLHFSGFNSANSTMILGEIDTAKLKLDGACVASTGCLIIKTISSVQGAAAQIQDMEAVTSQTSTVGSAQPKATFYTDAENIYSASIRFDKPMNRNSVNSGLGFAEGGNTINAMKVWLDQTLHLIVDTNGESSTTTGPLSYGKSYNISLSSSVMDTGGQALDCTNSPCATALATRPLRGWWKGTDSVVSGVTDGTIGKLALISTPLTGTNNTYYQYSWWAQNKMAVVTDADNVTVPRVKLEFSAKNKSSGNVQIVLKANVGGAPSCTPTLYIYSGGAYLFYATAGSSYCSAWKSTWDNQNISGQALFNGQWARYMVEFYDNRITLTATSEDGASQQYLNATDADLTTGFTGYTVDLTLMGGVDGSTGAGDLYYFDDFVVTKYDGGGAATTIFSENFTTANGSPPNFDGDGTLPSDNRIAYICDMSVGSTCANY